MIVFLIVVLNFLPHLLCKPESEYVQIEMIQTRDVNSLRHIRFSAFDKRYDLKLKPYNIFSEDFTLRSSENGNPVDRSLEDLQIANKLFIDRRNQASLYIDDSEHGPRVEGMIGDTFIKPSSLQRRHFRNGALMHIVTRIERSSVTYDKERASKFDTRKERQVESFPYGMVIGDTTDFPINVNNPNGEVPGIFVENPTNIENSRDEIPPYLMGITTYHEIPSEMTIEVAVVVDKMLSSFFVSDNEFIRYIGTFVNAANFPFSLLENPKMKLVLNGVVRNMNDEMQPYIESNLKDGFLMDNATNDLAKYMEANTWNFTYDIAILMTGHQLLATPGFRILGVTAYNMMCTKVNYAIIEDATATFVGVSVMPHEIGHTLGIDHDGTSKEQTPGYGFPSTEKCTPDEGYLMNRYDFSENGYRFSPCSIEQLRYSIRKAWHFNCLMNESPTYEDTGKLLPHDIYSNFNELCRYHYPYLPDIIALRQENDVPCSIACCTRVQCIRIEMIDGTPCGEKKICRFGTCVGAK